MECVKRSKAPSFQNMKTLFKGLDLFISSKDNSTMNCHQIKYKENVLFEIDLISFRIVKKSQFCMNYCDISSIIVRRVKNELHLSIEFKDKQMLSDVRMKI